MTPLFFDLLSQFNVKKERKWIARRKDFKSLDVIKKKIMHREKMYVRKDNCIAYRHDSFQALGTFEVDNTDICSYLLYQQHTACYADIDN